MFCIFLSNNNDDVIYNLSSDDHASIHVNVDPSQITSPLAVVDEVRK